MQSWVFTVHGTVNLAITCWVQRLQHLFTLSLQPVCRTFLIPTNIYRATLEMNAGRHVSLRGKGLSLWFDFIQSWNALTSSNVINEIKNLFML
jgi:hypothetical protein